MKPSENSLATVHSMASQPEHVIDIDGAPFNYSAFVRNLFAKRNAAADGLLHAGAGMAGEFGELIDSVKKTWVYGKPEDRANLVEELGDAEFYFHAACNLINLPSLRLDDAQFMVDEINEDGVDVRAVTLGAIGKGIEHAGAFTRLAASMIINDTVEPSEAESDILLSQCIQQLAGFRDALAVCYAFLGVTRDEALQANVAKLCVRFPHGYTDAAALARADKAAA